MVIASVSFQRYADMQHAGDWDGVAAGLQGIVVSNYSPKPMIGIASTIEVLPAIADAVGGKIPILIDGSFRRGSDVLKAIALGARAVLVGRAILWGLCHSSEHGATHILEILRRELDEAMLLCGCTKLSDVDGSLLRP